MRLLVCKDTAEEEEHFKVSVRVWRGMRASLRARVGMWVCVSVSVGHV